MIEMMSSMRLLVCIQEVFILQGHPFEWVYQLVSLNLRTLKDPFLRLLFIHSVRYWLFEFVA